MTQTDFLAALPIEIISLFALVIMLADALVERSTRLCQTLSIVGLLGGLAASVYAHITMPGQTAFSGMIVAGGMSTLYDIIFCGAGIMTVLLAREYHWSARSEQVIHSGSHYKSVRSLAQHAGVSERNYDALPLPSPAHRNGPSPSTARAAQIAQQVCVSGRQLM